MRPPEARAAGRAARRRLWVLGFVARLGFISEFLSRPILAGYGFGSGIIIVISQMESLFGLDIDTSLYTTDLGAVVRNLDDADGLTTVVGLSTVVLVLVLRRFVPKIPAPLLAVVLGIVRPHTAELGLVEGTDTFRDLGRNPDARPVPGLLIFRIDDELFFANAAFFVRDVKARLVASGPPATALVIDAEGVSDIDTTVIQELEELLDDLAAADVDVGFARVRQPVRDMIERAGLSDRVDAGAVFLEVDDAVEHFESNRRD